jgi:hypothetical protein
MNPEQLLAKEAIIRGNITIKSQADVENHQLSVLANELKLLIKQEAAPTPSKLQDFLRRHFPVTFVSIIMVDYYA